MEEALKIVRKEHPNDLVWYGFECKGKYWFGLTIGKEYHQFDGTLFGVVVDNGKCRDAYDYWKLLGTDDEMANAWKSRTKIDVQADF